MLVYIINIVYYARKRYYYTIDKRFVLMMTSNGVRPLSCIASCRPVFGWRFPFASWRSCQGEPLLPMKRSRLVQWICMQFLSGFNLLKTHILVFVICTAHRWREPNHMIANLSERILLQSCRKERNHLTTYSWAAPAKRIEFFFHDRQSVFLDGRPECGEIEPKKIEAKRLEVG